MCIASTESSVRAVGNVSVRGVNKLKLREKNVCLFLLLFSLEFLRYWQGVLVKQPRASLVGDHFLYSHDLNPLTPGGSSLK